MRNDQKTHDAYVEFDNIVPGDVVVFSRGVLQQLIAFVYDVNIVAGDKYWKTLVYTDEQTPILTVFYRVHDLIFFSNEMIGARLEKTMIVKSVS